MDTRGDGKNGGTLSRAEVATLLGVSVGTVRRMEGKDLHPEVTADGTHVFVQDEVRQVAASRKTPAVVEQEAAEPATQDNVPAPAPVPPSAPQPSASAPPGARAAAAFALFNAGVDAREAVVRLEAEPAEVRRLFGEWVAMGSDLLVPVEVRLQIERLAGGAITPAKLLAVIRHLLQLRGERRSFRYPCGECGEEIQASPDREWKALVEAGRLERWRHQRCHAGRTADGEAGHVDDEA